MSSAFHANAESLSAAQILAIPMNEPERIFPNDLKGIKGIKKALSLKWHPDKNPDAKAGDVLSHIIQLSEKAERKVELGTWSTPGVVEFSAKDKGGIRFQYLKKHDFELGKFYLTSEKIVYVVRPEHAELFDNAIETLKGLKFANNSMRDGFDVYFPKIVKHFEAKTGDRILVVERHPDSILLRDYFNYASGAVPPVHVAWMMSRLHNFTSYLQWAGLTHNGLTLDNCLIIPKDRHFKRDNTHPIAPKDHTVVVAGGWWYAAPVGKDLKALPPAVMNYVPRSVLSTGIADAQIDRTMIRVMGRQMLGDATGVRLQHNKDIPRPMADWLLMPGSGDAIDDFVTWRKKILTDSFGPQKFVELDVRPNDVYQPKP
jgi:hypothetical protein